MRRLHAASMCRSKSVLLACAHAASAGTDVFFNPLTQSAAVAQIPDHVNELNATPYRRPEDLEVAYLKNGNEVVCFTATEELESNKVFLCRIVLKASMKQAPLPLFSIK